MIGRLKLGALTMAWCVTSIACGASPTAPGTQMPLNGAWNGTVTPDSGGTGTATMVLAQVGDGVSGTFSLAAAGSGLAANGTVGGTVSGASIALFLTPSVPLVCSPVLTLSGTIGTTLTIGTGRLSGRYLVTTCTGAQVGSVDFVRQ